MVYNLFRSHLFWRLFIANMGLTTAFIVTAMLGASYQYEQHLLREVKLRHDTVSKRIAREMGLFFQQASLQVSIIKDFVNNRVTDTYQTKADLDEVTLDIPHFMEISLIDPKGNVQITTNPDTRYQHISSPEIMQSATEGRQWISKVKLTGNRIPYVDMSDPITMLGKPKGALVTQLSLKKLWIWIDEISAESGTYLSVAKSENGLTIADEKKEYVGNTHPLWGLYTENKTITTPDGMFYVSFHRVPRMDLTIVTQSLASSYAGEFTHVRNQIIAIGLVLSFLSLVMTMLFSAKATQPARILTKAMKGSAMTGEKVSEDLPGEYFYIAKTFNKIVSQLRENQKVITQQESLVAVGRVASALAHELRHGLHLISSIIYLMKIESDDKELLRTTVNDMVEKIGNLMEFARGGTIYREEVNCRYVVKQAMISFRFQLPGQEKPALTYSKLENHNIMADESKLVSCVSNLVRNALEAGATRVEAGVRLDGGMVLFSVKDNGPGVSDDLKEKVFEPFFSTKSKGFGVGLALVASVAKVHEGDVYIHQTGPEGSEFHFRIKHIPANGQEAPAMASMELKPEREEETINTQHEHETAQR